MVHFDTSFLVPLILPEATSDRVAEFLGGLSAEEFAVSYWTRVEFSSLIAREVRIGGLEAAAATRADARFEAMVRDSFTVLLPCAADFVLAKKYLGNFATGCAPATLCTSPSPQTAMPRPSTASTRRW